MALDFVVDAFVGLDGSKYYGTLKNGVPSGLGTCIWPNQCHYDGEWRDGLMHGFGTYVWKTGQRYDGEWKDGRRDGIGIKTYADGSMYDGFWRAGKKHGLGVFRPAPDESGSRRHSNHMGWQPQQQRASGTNSPEAAPADLAAQSVFAEQELAAASVSSESHDVQPAAAGAATAAGAPGPHLQDLRHIHSAAQNAAPVVEQQPQVQLSTQQQQQQQQQQQAALYKQRSGGKPHLVSPFLAAAAVLNSETSILGEPPRLQNGSWQQSPSEAAAAAAGGGGGGTRSRLGTGAGDKLPAADGAAPSSAAAGTAAAVGSKPGEATDSSALVPAVAAGVLGAGAPRKLFVREYNVGQLVREYPLTAEEIKMIFGFLWPKANKVRRHMQRVLRRGPRMQKKMGEVVYKGNPSYAIMANLQLGIRYSVGRGPWPPSQAGSWLGLGGLGVGVAPWGSSGGAHKEHHVQPEQEKAGHRRQLSDALSGNTGGVLTAADFDEKRTLHFPTDGSSITPAHPNTDFKWNDYAPRVFRRLRRSSGIDEADYMISLGGSQALRQLSSPGKSGSMFLLSEDERFLVKTMRKSEMKVLLDMLPAYAAHMEKHPHSLITRFFGLHKLRPLHGRSVRFVVMANIFVTDLQIHRRYDIKGSTDGRTVGAEARSKAAEGDPGVIFKDLDVDLRIVLEQSAHDKLMAQLAADCELLRTVGVMDYSLLLGVHYPARHYMRASLEAVPSFSLDGTLPHTSPLPAGILPGSALGSFSEGHHAALAAVGPDGAAGAAPGFHPRTYTTSDDDIQQPPQQLQRLAAQQQQLSLQLQQAQQQGIQAARQQQQPMEVFGPWSAPAGARLTAQSSISSVGSERLALEQYSAGGAGPGSSLGPSPQPPNLQSLQQQQGLPALAVYGDELPSVASPQQQQQAGSLQWQHSGRISAPTSGVASAAGAAQSAEAAAAAIAAAGAAAAVAESTMPGWSSSGVSAAPVGSAVTSAAGAGSGTTSGLGAAGGSSAAGAPVAAHPQLLAMVNHPCAGSGAGARNWELFSGAAELEDRLGKVSERMQEMGFSEQRIKDVAELARLKILGSKLKKSATRKEPPSVVLQAMQQQRQVAEGTTGGGAASLAAPLDGSGHTPGTVVLSPSTAGAAGLMRHQPPPLSHLTSLRGAFAGLGVPFEEDEEAVDTPMALGLPDPRAPAPTPPPVPNAAAFGYTTAAGLPLGQQLGINMLALAVPQPPLGGAAVCGGGASAASSRRTSNSVEGQRGRAGSVGEGNRGPEEVVLCFGIIDILQDYSTRKVLERTVKGLTHDKAAISVAPPKSYAKRFLDFVTHKVFMPECEYNEQRQIQQPAHTQQQFTQAVSLAGRRVSEASSVDDGVMMGPVLPGGQQYQQQLQQQQAAMAKQHGPLAAIATAPTAAAGAAGGAAGSPGTPLLSFDDAHMLAAGAADMNLGLLGSPEALSGPESSGAFPLSSNGTHASTADGFVSDAAGYGMAALQHQVVSAEELSVSVPVAEQADSSANSLPQQQQQGGEVLPAVVVELQQAGDKPKAAAAGAPSAAASTMNLKQQHGGMHKGVLGGQFELVGHQGGSSSPAEAEVIVVNGNGGAQQQQQGRQSHLGSQHANLLAKLGL